MDKNWNFIISDSKQTKTNSLATTRTQKKLKINTLLQEQRKYKQNKNIGVPPVKRFFIVI
jgi:hypothetical protein